MDKIQIYYIGGLDMEALYENRKLKVTYCEECSDDIKNKTYIFNIDIKDFDTPTINVEYDDNDKVILRTWIENEDEENGPKGHVIYKLFSLIEFEVCKIMQFMIKHV